MCPGKMVRGRIFWRRMPRLRRRQVPKPMVQAEQLQTLHPGVLPGFQRANRLQHLPPGPVPKCQHSIWVQKLRGGPVPRRRRDFLLQNVPGGMGVAKQFCRRMHPRAARDVPIWQHSHRILSMRRWAAPGRNRPNVLQTVRRWSVSNLPYVGHVPVVPPRVLQQRSGRL